MKSKKKQIPKSVAKEIVQKDNINTIRIMAFVIFCLSFFVYANTFKNGYVLDDSSAVKDNWLVKRGITAIPTLFKTSYRYGYWTSADNLYRPLSLVMLAVEWQLWPDNPKPSHVINVLLYALACLLLFLTLRKLFQQYSVFFPFIATVIFALHPIHTEVIANIKSRDEILSFLFLVLTLQFVIQYIGTSKNKWLLFGTICYFFAFLSKESAVTFLAVIPLTIYFFTNATNTKNIFVTSILFIPALFFLAIRAKILYNQPALAPILSVDNLLVAAPDILTRYATAIKIMGKYLWMLLVPYPLISDYSYNQITISGWGNLWTLLSFVILLAMAIFSIWKIKTKHVLAFAGLFFFVIMSLYSNILMLIGTSFGERFLFIPALAFGLTVAWLILWLLKIPLIASAITKPPKFFLTKNKVLFVLFPIIIFYSIEIYSRNKEWYSNETLYSTDVLKSPNSAHLRYHYGLILMQKKALGKDLKVEHPEYLDSAIVQFKQAAKISPTYSDAYDQIGLAYYRKNMNDSALKYYQKALDYNAYRPVTFSNMGIIYFNNKQFEKAIDVLQKALKYNPAFADAWRNMGSTLATIGKNKEAIDAYKKCLEFDPQNALVNYFMSITYKKMGDKTNAKFYLDRAADLDPKYSQQK